MHTPNFLQLQAAQDDTALAGCWKLMPRRAISLRPRAAGMLRIAQGQVWATFDGAQPGPANELGDHFLHAGQRLAVRAGQHLVLESIGAAGEAPVYFEWTMLAEPASVRAARWQATVVRPLQDLGQGLLMAGRALAQLVAGLARYGAYPVAGRGRVMPELDAKQP